MQSAVSATKKSKPDFLTIREAALFLRLSKSRLYLLTERRKIPFYKPGQKILFRLEDLRAYVERGRREVEHE